MKRRRLCLCLALLLVALLLLPGVHWRLIGWMKGEAFYQGRPTTYWSREAQNLEHPGVAGSDFDWEPRPSWIEQYLATVTASSSRQFALFNRDENALPVLIELLEDPDSQVRQIAAQSLFHLGPKAKLARPALLPLCDEQNDNVRWNAIWALMSIDQDDAGR